LMPLKHEHATVEEVETHKIIALKFELNQRYFSPEHEAFFEICSDAERAALLVHWHQVSWN